MLFRYEMSPENKVPTWAWSLGDPYNEMDIWTSNISVEEFGLILRKYDYIYLYNIDEQFLNKYWELFGFSQNVHDFSLWSINSDNQLLLNYEEDLQYYNN